MLKVAFRSIWSRKGRLFLTSLAIIAGTAFLGGVFIFSDTLRKSFDELFETAFEHTDAYVRSSNEIELEFGQEVRERIPDSLVEEVRAIPGVHDAVPSIVSFARLTTVDGDDLGDDNGAPQFGAIWDDSPLTSWQLAEGRGPRDGTEVVIDRGSALEGDLQLGEQVKVSAAVGPARTFTVVGIATFGGHDSSGTTTWAMFDLATAEEFVVGAPGMIDGVVVGCGGCPQREFADSIAAALDMPGVEVLTGEEITEENLDAVEGFLTFFSVMLTIFAFISLFVGSFIIYNVFSISAAQRQRENALLRAIGASRGQVSWALLLEGLVVGIGGSILGFAGGFGLATVILPALGAEDVSLTVKPSAFVVTLVVGVIVTMLCSLVPALRAGRVPPLAAMRDVAFERADLSRRRVVAGAVFGLLAVGGITLGLTADPVWLGLGVVALFVTVIVLGPVVAGPVARLFTAPLGRIRGVTGEIAGRNAARSPKRTALTAGALAVGLALVVAVGAMAASIKTSIENSFGTLFTGDLTISYAGQGSGFGGLATSLSDDVGEVPGVAASVGVGFNPVTLTIGDDEQTARLPLTVSAVQAARALDLGFVAGGWDGLGPDSILVSKDKAERDGIELGSTVGATFLNGTQRQVTVTGIYENDDLSNLVVDRSFFDGSGLPGTFDQLVLVTLDPSADRDAVIRSIRDVAAGYPLGTVETRQEFIDRQSDTIDQFLYVIYALLTMSIFIAVLGIAITISLAVYERRRELGLMRAVGMTRGQVRGSVRWEAMITALIGAVMGLALGLTLGWVVVKSLEDQGLNSFTLPITTIVSATVFAVVVGLLASLWPAFKAARSSILEAIATT